ncbi:unnamed protein product [Anisakis simplex]|uniref:FGGY_N domain-containing protein n=1 Tax=Anisakis simplex TaxID=6269 RepID=A0A0M3K0G5_ANISI|nr:unnamed protein product [Anisakis simplex]
MCEAAVAVGIDLGTTSIKVCAIDSSETVVEEKSAVHDAWIQNDSPDRKEQCAEKIFAKVIELLQSMRPNLKSVKNIVITGQMHGIILWNNDSLVAGEFSCSPLITWMDSRVPQQFIDSLPKWEYGDVHAGYGIVTLAWLYRNSLLDPKWNCCGTNEIVPLDILPKIVPNGTIVGIVRHNGFGLPTNAMVYASLGDLQATVYPLLTNDSAVLNLGTSAQLCFRYNGDHRKFLKDHLLFEPFFDDFKLITAASMNGGNAVHLLAEKILEWASALSVDHIISDRLTLDFEKFEQILNSSSKQSSLINVEPTFYEERSEHLPSVISGLRSDTSIAELLHATAKGVIANLNRLLSTEILHSNGITRLILAGNANKEPYSTYIKEIFKDFEICASDQSKASAAYGAALFASRMPVLPKSE